VTIPSINVNRRSDALRGRLVPGTRSHRKPVSSNYEKKNSARRNPRPHGNRKLGPRTRCGQPDRAEDPLFVPPRGARDRRRTPGGGGDRYAAILESICGVRDDSQPVEQYDGTLGVTALRGGASTRRARSNGTPTWPQIYTNRETFPACAGQWDDDLGRSVSDLRPSFDQTGGGWQRRARTVRQYHQSAGNRPQHASEFNFQVIRQGTCARSRVSHPRPGEYRLGGLDMAFCRMANPGTTSTSLVSPTDAARPEISASSATRRSTEAN